MRLFLQILSLSDRYERKARLLPGLHLAAVPALTAGAVLQPFAAWYAAAGIAIGVGFLAAIVLGQLARARGRRVEAVLWKAWGGPSTTRWLRPWDHTCSDQQDRGTPYRSQGRSGDTIPISGPRVHTLGSDCGSGTARRCQAFLGSRSVNTSGGHGASDRQVSASGYR